MTLVELLVVLAIIGLIVGMSVPALTKYGKHVRLKTSMRQAIGLISLARSLAISAHADHALIVDPEHRELRIMNMVSGDTLEHVVRLPSSVKVEVEVGGESSPQTQIVFLPTGGLQGRTTSLLLEDEDTQHRITITGTTGAVSVN